MASESTLPEQKSAPGAFTTKDVGLASVVYFDGAPTFAHNNGIITVTLAVGRHLSKADGGVDTDVVAVAYLKSSVAAAIDLRDAINQALLLAAPPADGGMTN